MSIASHRSWRNGALTLGVCLMSSVAFARDSSTYSTIGTLTCMTSETPPSATADAELSCRYQALSGGREGGFTGYITRKGLPSLPPGQRVLVWSVLAAKPDVEPRALVGRYSGETGGPKAERLIGGEDGKIVLRSATVTSQVGDQLIPTVLDLRLEPVKA